MAKDFVFITSNQKKADYLAKWLDLPVEHQKVEVDEVQSLDLREVVERKAKSAYALVKRPVLVEDISVTFLGAGKLPGPLIRWFLEELGDEGLCRFVDGLPNRKARVEIMYAYYDGHAMHITHAAKDGAVPKAPRHGDSSFGWNSVFIPKGSTKTYAEMDEAEFTATSHRAAAVRKLAEFLHG